MPQNTGLSNIQQQVVSVSFFNKAVPPVAVGVDGIPAWVSSDPTVLTVTPSVDGLSATIATTGVIPAEDVTVTVTADADLGGGVRTISGQFTVRITDAGAFVVEFTFGDATDIPTV